MTHASERQHDKNAAQGSNYDVTLSKAMRGILFVTWEIYSDRHEALIVI